MTPTRRRSALPTVAIVAVVAIAGTLTGCRQAPLDPGFRTPATDEPEPPTVARVDYVVPNGFVETYIYQTGNHLYPIPTVEHLIPAEAVDDYTNLDVIGVMSYLMDIDVSDWSDDQLAGQVAEYVAAVGEPIGEPGGEPVSTTVDGRPAFTVTVAEPDADDPEVVYTYDATYIFAGSHLVQVQCQYHDRQELVDQACAALLDSMKIIV
jgi:hypothetical protein